MESFEGKVRQVGSSLGILIPQTVVLEEKLKKNETVRVVILKKNLKAIAEALGAAKGARPFVRDHHDRVI
ncbi:MAG: hypothetical protein HY393_04190 [Candidatus Diapherotrites archaeon]|nr:hypothetical protein [Candidatus Diapherotrites archaeon]